MHEKGTGQPNDVQLGGTWHQRNLGVDGLRETKVDQGHLDYYCEEGLDHQLGMPVVVVVVPNHEVCIAVDISLEVQFHYL